jgi:CRP/FNR family transcriptional regulator
MDIPSILRKTFLFSSLSDKQIGQLVDFTTVKELKKDDILFMEGDPAEAFYLVESGKIKIYRISDEGQEHTLEIHEAGDLVAEAAIFDKETYPAFCQAMEDCTLLRIPKADFVALVRKYPDFGIRVMHGYSKRLRFLVNRLEDQSMHDVRSRLAAYLIKHISTENKQLVCHIPISKKELASFLGTIPETLSRTLSAMKRDGIILQEGEKIIVLDHKKLVKLI